jgi:hypothetical protein
MLPQGYSRRDAMLVLSAMSRIDSITTAEGAAGRVTTQEVLDALKRMERPEDFWDLLWAYSDGRILEFDKEMRGDVRFTMSQVQAHDVTVFLHQNREEYETYHVINDEEDPLHKVFIDGLEETRARAVFY